MGNAKGYAIDVDFHGNMVWSTGISPYMNSSGFHVDFTFGNGNYTDEFIVSDEFKIEHMDIESGKIEFKRNPNYIKFDTSMCTKDIYIMPNKYDYSYINTPAILKADFS